MKRLLPSIEAAVMGNFMASEVVSTSTIVLSKGNVTVILKDSENYAKGQIKIAVIL